LWKFQNDVYHLFDEANEVFLREHGIFHCKLKYSSANSEEMVVNDGVWEPGVSCWKKKL
jgi:hypothetical protein